MKTGRQRASRVAAGYRVSRCFDAEENYRSLTEGALYGIYRSTVDGRFLTVNPAMVEMLGFGSSTELLAVDMARDVYANPSERVKLVEKYRDRQKIEGVEVEWRRKDGSHLTVRLSGRPVRNACGEVECFEMIAEDVTERRALEAQLRQSQKMEAVGQLTGGIAHDFNNILTVILANADLLEADLPTERADLKAVLQETRTAAQRGSDLVKKLLGFSRRGKLEMRPTDLAQLVANLSGVLRRVLPENVEVEMISDPPLDPAMADPGAIEQILLNLATNARDAMPGGGRLTIEVRSDWLDEGYHATHPWVEPGRYVSISVTDTGVGMDPQTKERVFEPFFTTKPEGRGTGLGLAMIYGTVKQHKGHIHLYSEVGKGTTVKIYVPVASSAPPATPPTSTSEAPVRGSETILIVEDDLSIRRATRRALESHGYTVLSAADGEEALDQVRQRGPSAIDLIITDLVMPKLGGRQLYEALLAAGIRTSVVFASGYSRRDIQECAAIEGDVPFLHKPWTLSELLSRVREAIRSNEKQQRPKSRMRELKPGHRARTRSRSVPPVTASAWLNHATGPVGSSSGDSTS
ncbi:MAG: response regulator [Gemmatimonadota bacterium]|nr:MAG: response regulator [Gemmatimonadota bacterium]